MSMSYIKFYGILQYFSRRTFKFKKSNTILLFFFQYSNVVGSTANGSLKIQCLAKNTSSHFKCLPKNLIVVINLLNGFINCMQNMTRTKSTRSGSDLTCPHCSSTVDETENSIGCDKSGCWVHHTCTKIPTEALTYMSTVGVFWFCNEYTKALKLVRLKTSTEVEF